VQETLFPSETVILFGPREAELSAQFYKSLARARGREVDLAIAACAVVRDADLWTLNPRDFEDIPKVRLWAHHGLS
jgi:predicted nucleic acid-binding protein